MFKKIFTIIFFFYILFFNSFNALISTPGKLNQDGCHNSKQAGYHCHNKNSKKVEAAKENQKVDSTATYNRKNWGQWEDKDKDCQNLRHEILIAFSETPVTFRSEKQCLVLKGQWLGPYTGKVFTQSNQIDIDHLVPLKEAYLSGGKYWTRTEKSTFYNDPINLIAVSKVANRKKGAKDIANWMPKKKEFHCQYLSRWVEVKEKYNLNFDRREEKKINQLKKRCKDGGG